MSNEGKIVGKNNNNVRNSLTCDTCGVSFTGQENAQQHYSSEKHRKQVVLMEKHKRGESLPLECKICKCSFTGQENAEDHFKSKKHKRNKENMSIQSEGLHTETAPFPRVVVPGPQLHVMHEDDTFVHQDDSPNLSRPVAPSTQSVKTATDPHDLPHVFKPVPVKSADLFQYVKEHPDSSKEDINHLHGTSTKSVFKEEINDTFLAKPVQDRQQMSTVRDISAGDDEDELIVKPIENDDDNQNTESRTRHRQNNSLSPTRVGLFKRVDTENDTKGYSEDSLVVKPVDGENETQNRQTNREWPETNAMFESLSELKIKEETNTHNVPEFKSVSRSTGDFSSRNTLPVRFVKNDLDQSLAPMGRGRGIFTMLRQQDENLPEKVVNSNKLNNEYLYDCEIYDDNETQKKSVWQDTPAAPRRKITDNEGDDSDENEQSQYNSQPHFTKNNGYHMTVSRSPSTVSSSPSTVSSSPAAVSSSPTNFFHQRYGERGYSPSDLDTSSKLEEYIFDPCTGRGKCYICDIDFTSSKHKSQHILGKNHLKAKEVRQGLIKVGKTASGSLICTICSVTFPGPEARQQHFESEKHKRKVMRHQEEETNSYYCDICQISCTGPESFTQHRLGAQHRKLAGELNEEYQDMSAPNYDRTKWYPCEICKCNMNTIEQLRFHEKSPKHLKQLEKQMPGGLPSNDRTQWFPCNVCKVNMNTYEQLKIHEQSPRHIKQMEKQMPSAVGSSDRTQWFPCRICNVNMNTFEQLKIHEQSPRHLKQLEKQMDNGNTSPHDRSTWFPCNVCNCKMNTREQLRIHEASPAHIAKLRKYNDIQQMAPSDSASRQIIDPSWSPGSATPLESFLSEELFPEEFLPPSDSTMHNNNTKKLEDYFQEQLVESDKPFPRAPRFAVVTPEQLERDTTNSPGAGGTKRGMGSDLAFATRNRGTRENSNRSRERSTHSCTDDSPSQSVRPMQFVTSQEVGYKPNQNMHTAPSKMDPTENNPYAATHRYYCHTCKAPMNTKETYDNHIRGKRHMQKVCTEQAPKRQHNAPINLPEDFLPYTKTNPRNYQQELYKKNMRGNTLCFLPTGTGKTLVSVMTMSAMLEKHPSKNVLFLVDKVLLVIQQSQYIKSELEEREFNRFNPDSDNPLDIERRKLRIAAVCMGQQATHGIPLWKHDVVVVTAAFCQNLLDKQILRWEDFSLIVFDEAHHCEKGHPFNTLLSTYHRRTLPENKPKVLGLTASPAGKADVPKTLQMLRGLISNMGGVRMTIVEEHENVDTLNEYQSNSKMIIRPQLAPSDLIESGLRHELNIYIMNCLMKLYQFSNIKHYVDFGRGFTANISDEEVKRVADDFVEKNFDMIQSSMNMIDNENEKAIGKAEFYHLCMHVQSICMALSCLEEGGVLIALSELEELETTDFNLNFARRLGLPTVPLQQIVARQGAGLGGQDANSATGLHMQRLIDELTADMSATEGVRSISLVLVKQRCTAHQITKVLLKSDRMRKLGLNTTCVVGHGGSGAADKGMNVNQQKRVLEEIKQYQYQVIVATSVAEEGVDMPECERVISLYPPSTVTALVQMRGRARRKNSKFIVLCSNQEEEGKLYDIMQKEKNMIEATELLMQENRDTEAY
ncbi:uncharacterized protein LOC132717609 isoform X2 [Ruditapes philippinarum]|nr:uncharacterized protein LOC132717609 isoform X2 [Ruditapes philippinarum]